MLGILLAEKLQSAQQFTEDGVRKAVTHLQCKDVYLVGVMSQASRGYDAIKLGFSTAKRIAKPVEGELKKANISIALKYIREFRTNGKDIVAIEEEGKKGIKVGEQSYFIGDRLSADTLFAIGDKVDVSGTTKGKGFQGVVRRHGFAGGPRTHGQSNRLRAPGSMGSGTTPGRVFKGKKLAGRTGAERVTVKSLEVMSVTDSSIVVAGLIPGHKNTLIEIRKAK